MFSRYCWFIFFFRLLFDGTGVHKIGSERLLEETFSSEDDVYMIVQRSSAARTGLSASGDAPCTTVSQRG